MIAIRTAKTRTRFSRRALLKQLGASAALLPLVSAERALGAAGAPKRLVTIAWGNGVAQPAFYPAGDDPTGSTILKPLAPYRSKVLLPCGLDITVMMETNHKFDGHFSMPSLFTGTYRNLGGQRAGATGPSIDQVHSDEVAKTVNLPVPLMNLIINRSTTSFRRDGGSNTGETNPRRMFDRLFASKTTTPDQLAMVRARRQSVIDHLGPELDHFSARLGNEDRAKIASHLDAVRRLEKELSATSSAGAGTCAGATAPTATDIPGRIRAFADLAGLALRCDLTRSVSMTWGDNGGSYPQTFSFMGVGGDAHNIAHAGPGGYGSKTKMDLWYFEQVARLVKELDEIPEAGGTALDNSVVVVSSDMSEGAVHHVAGLPFVLIGGAGGKLRTGRVVKLGTWNKDGKYYAPIGGGGVPHNKLLASVVTALDIRVDGFGSNHKGLLPELMT